MNKLPEDTGLIVLAALRYSIGRRTYMPSTVADYIVNNWQYLDKTRPLLIKDVDMYLSDHDQGLFDIGDDCDYQTWSNLLKWMKDNL